MYERKTKSFLQYFGVGDTYLGFHFCAYSVKLATEHPEWLRSVTKSIYPEVAKKFGTSCGCVERNIRTVAEVIWQKGGREYFKKMTGRPTPDRRPTNSKFLELLTAYVLSENDIDPEMDHDLLNNCESLYDCRQKLIRLDKENRELQRTVDRMQDMIGELEKELDECRRPDAETDE